MTATEQEQADFQAVAKTVEGREMNCSSVSASWCPIHGDCICRDPEDLNDDDCPLHSEASTHGQAQEVATAWGLMPLGGDE